MQLCSVGSPITRSLRVNLRRERFVRTGPLNPNLPPLQTHPHAAAARQEPTLAERSEQTRARSQEWLFHLRSMRPRPLTFPWRRLAPVARPT